MPQVELPEDTNGLIPDFIASAPSPAHARAVAHIGRARQRIREVAAAGGTSAAARRGDHGCPQPAAP